MTDKIPAKSRGTCPVCSAKVLWALIGARRMAIDPQPARAGNMDLSVRSGELYAIIGSTGPGKYSAHYFACGQTKKSGGKAA